jgi:hypothetical protein
MIICANCGVELDVGLKICPLCGKVPGDNREKEHMPSDNAEDIIRLQKKENKKYLWELIGIVAFSAIAVCTIVDLLISKGLKWSLLCDVSILAFWIILTLFMYSYKRTFIIVPGLLVTILVALSIIDLITPGRSWFFPVGLPLTIAAFITAGIVLILYRIANFKGLNILASSFIVLSGYCIIIEMVLDKYMNGIVDLHWSLIAAISILPVALIFFFYHYRLKKGNRLDSFFHI